MSFMYRYKNMERTYCNLMSLHLVHRLSVCSLLSSLINHLVKRYRGLYCAISALGSLSNQIMRLVITFKNQITLRFSTVKQKIDSLYSTALSLLLRLLSIQQ